MGARVTLIATPAPGATFDGWSVWECPGRAFRCTVAVDEDRTVVASFDPVFLTVSRSGAGGRVTSDPAGITCGAACGLQVASYRRGTPVTLSAAQEGGL